MREPDYKAFGARMMILRRQSGLTLTAFAGYLETNTRMVHRWEDGHNYPGYWTIVNIAKKCGCSFDWLITGCGPMNPVR